MTVDEELDAAIADELAAHGTLVPPWVKFPEIPNGSIGWRMGDGEWYLWMWQRWSQARSDVERAAYHVAWPPPAGWADVYEPIDDDDQG